MIVGVHHFALHTGNFDRMQKFYKDAFGFEPCRGEFNWQDLPVIDHCIDVPGSAARSTMLKCRNVYIELFEFSAPPPDSTRPLRPYDRGYTHICFETNDMARDFEHLKSCGMDFTGRDFIAMNDVKAIYGYDPDGNVIELQQCSLEDPQSIAKLEMPDV